jgi:hypothetical protein
VKRCKEPEFGGIACTNYKCNIYQYVDADPRQVALMMMQAEKEAFTLYSIGTAHNVPFRIVLVFCLLMAGRAWLKEHQSTPPAPVQIVSRTTAVQSTVTSNTQQVYKMIDDTLHMVTKDMTNKVDVNKDGKINCIDAAVSFYKHFPDKNIVCIEANYAINHAFNCVKVGDVWRAIEPNAYNTGWGYEQWWMRTVWKEQYDASKNVDETEYFLRYVK